MKTNVLTIAIALSTVGFNVNADQTCFDNSQEKHFETYERLEDNVIKDKQTLLIWRGCLSTKADADCTNDVELLSWNDALKAVDKFNIESGQTWRLPNPIEVGSIIRSACLRPSLNALRFDDISDLVNNKIYVSTNNLQVWTSTSSYRYPEYAYTADLIEGEIATLKKNNKAALFLVRTDVDGAVK